jgi:osomolarity two-component system response regulator SSK1
MQALIDFEGWRKWRGYEDSPRTITPIKHSSTSPSPARNGAVQAVRVSNIKDGGKASVASPDSSESSSSKDEDPDVPGVAVSTEATQNGF